MCLLAFFNQGPEVRLLILLSCTYIFVKNKELYLIHGILGLRCSELDIFCLLGREVKTFLFNNLTSSTTLIKGCIALEIKAKSVDKKSLKAAVSYSIQVTNSSRAPCLTYLSVLELWFKSETVFTGTLINTIPFNWEMKSDSFCIP